jgi:hypothetical protein
MSAAITIFIAGVIIYFLPANIKVDGLTKITGIVPDAVKAKAEELILTPPEKRGKLIAELENNITALKQGGSMQETGTMIEESEKIIAELKEKNEETSLTEIVKVKLVEQLLNRKANQEGLGACEPGSSLPLE